MEEYKSIEKILKEVPKFALGQPTIQIGTRPKTLDLVEALNYTRFRVKPSPKGGVGLFALRKINKDEVIFLGVNENSWDEVLSQEDYQKLTPAMQEMVSDYCVFIKGEWLLPNDLFAELLPVYFINHSKEPNLATKDEGVTFKCLKDIEPGEELTFDYNVYEEDRRLGFEEK